MDLQKGVQKLQNYSVNVNEASKKLALLFDDGSYTELFKFYKNGEEQCNLVTAYGQIGGTQALAFAQTSGKDGAMGEAVSKKLCKLYEMAEKLGVPVVGVYNSDGAHIEEGIACMEAYASVMANIAKISGVVPQISVVSGSCIGTLAVMASMADIVIMEKESEMYVTSATVLKNKNVGTAQLCAQNGTAAIIAENTEQAFNKVSEVLSFLPQNNLCVPFSAEYVPSENNVTSLDGLQVISATVDGNSFLELYKENSAEAITGFARVNGNSVAVVATNVNGGKITAKATNKIARFVRLADAYSLPVITFVDCLGIMGNAEDELAGGVKQSAQLTQAYSEATCPKITVITGAAVGSAYIAFASKASGADSVFAWPNAYISSLEPLTTVELLMKDKLKEGKSREELAQDYQENCASVFAAAEKGFIEDIITPLETAPKLAIALDALYSKRVNSLGKKHSNIQL